MVGARRTAVRWWRWRRNPLRRRSDVVEAWIVLVTWMLAVVGGLLTGLMTASAIVQGLDRERSERQQLSAVVTKTTTDASTARQLGAPQTWGTARWFAPDGAAHTDRTRVPPGTPAEARITVWTDEHGRLAKEPLSPADAAFRVAVVGGLAAVGVGMTVWGCGRTARACLARQRLRQWDEEWVWADTQWGGRTG